MIRRFAGTAFGLCVMAFVATAARADLDIACFTGTWRAVGPGGKIGEVPSDLVQRYEFRDTVLEIHPDRFVLRHPDYSIDTPASIDWRSGSRIRMHFAEPQYLYNTTRENILLEAVGPGQLRAEILERQPLSFWRPERKGPSDCKSRAKSVDPVPDRYRGRWIFKTILGYKGELTKSEVEEKFSSLQMDVRQMEIAIRFQRAVTTESYRWSKNPDGSLVITTEHPFFGGSFGHEVRAELKAVDPDELLVHLPEPGKPSVLFERRKGLEVARPPKGEDAPSKHREPGKLVLCEMGGRAVYTEAHRCPDGDKIDRERPK